VRFKQNAACTYLRTWGFPEECSLLGCGAMHSSSHLFTLVPRSQIFLSWRWSRHVPPKRRFSQDLHGATSQKTTFFVLTAVVTSSPTCVFHAHISCHIILFDHEYYTKLLCFRVCLKDGHVVTRIENICWNVFIAESFHCIVHLAYYFNVNWKL
jgi:hypothetical protein